jgi:WD40 repeat protein
MPDIYEIVNSTQLDSDLEDIADAIRAKSQGQDPLLFPSEFISEIGSIPTGASITGATDDTVEAMQNLTQNNTCYIFKAKYSKLLILDDVASTTNNPRPVYSPDGTRLIVNSASSPFVRIYDCTQFPYALLSSEISVSQSCYDFAWSPDGTRLAITHAASPYVSIYDTTTTPYTKLSAPSTLPTGAAYHPAWSPDGTRLAIPHTGSPYVTIYDTTSVPYSKIADPSTLPTGNGKGSAWNPAGTRLAVSHATSPYITIYDTTTVPYSKIANPRTLPAGESASCKFSPDGAYLAVTSSNSPYIQVYNTATSPYTKLANPGSLPTSTGNECSFSPDGSLLIVANSGSSPVCIYDTSSIPFVRQSFSLNPSSNAFKVSWAGRYFAIGKTNSPHVYIYVLKGNNDMGFPANNKTISGAYNNQNQCYGYAKETISKGSTGTAAILFEP